MKPVTVRQRSAATVYTSPHLQPEITGADGGLGRSPSTTIPFPPTGPFSAEVTWASDPLLLVPTPIERRVLLKLARWSLEEGIQILSGYQMQTHDGRVLVANLAWFSDERMRRLPFRIASFQSPFPFGESHTSPIHTSIIQWLRLGVQEAWELDTVHGVVRVSWIEHEMVMTEVRRETLEWGRNTGRWRAVPEIFEKFSPLR